MTEGQGFQFAVYVGVRVLNGKRRYGWYPLIDEVEVKASLPPGGTRELWFFRKRHATAQIGGVYLVTVTESTVMWGEFVVSIPWSVNLVLWRAESLAALTKLELLRRERSDEADRKLAEQLWPWRNAYRNARGATERAVVLARAIEYIIGN